MVANRSQQPRRPCPKRRSGSTVGVTSIGFPGVDSSREWRGSTVGREAVVIDTDACTLCLACVSLCPVGALGENQDKPQVNFQDAACLQCGICASTCPETAITLAPQLDTSKAALDYRVLHEEEPFECIQCGTPFGVKSTIERIVEKLSGQHWMYTNSDNARLIQMCDDCRVVDIVQDAEAMEQGFKPPAGRH